MNTKKENDKVINLKRKILNIGCGIDSYGTHKIDLYPQQPGVERWDVNNGLPYNFGYFDEVYSKNLFEHLPNPELVLYDMLRVTKPGGRVIIITDNASYWLYALKNQAHTGAYEKNNDSEDRHYCLFTEHHLKNFGRLHGITNIKTELVSEEQTTKWYKTIIKRTIEGVLKRTMFKNMVYGRVKVIYEKNKK